MGISLQILDGTHGLTAGAVATRLERAGLDGWETAATGQTGSDGRVEDLGARQLERGLYRIVLDSDAYFASLGVSSAYPDVTVSFRISRECPCCRVEVALSPYSYSAHFVTVAGPSATGSC